MAFLAPDQTVHLAQKVLCMDHAKDGVVAVAEDRQAGVGRREDPVRISPGGRSASIISIWRRWRMISSTVRCDDWLEAHGPALRDGDAAARLHAVTRSVEMKAGIVSRDETEEGERALLNLGHTFCHALEKATGYSDRLLHGEGVAIGCALAFELSSRLGLCSQEDPSRVRAHLKAMGTKVDLADIPDDLPGAEVLLAYMAQDKKVVDGQLRFILARGIGEAFVAADVPGDAVLRLLRDALA